MTKIPRRMVLTGLASVPFIGKLTRPNQPASAQTGLEAVSVKTPSGRPVSGMVAVPATIPAPAVLLIHGSSGLSDVIEGFTEHFARDGFFALALDLFDGRTANDEEHRAVLRNEVNSNPAKAAETIAAWIEWLKADRRTNGKVGVVGYSFGARWALEASINTPVEATVVYVGLIDRGAKGLALLKGPVMLHLAERDTDVSKSDVEWFENTMTEAGKSVVVNWYPSDHYFPFPSYPSYDKKLADAAWARSTKFLHTNLQ
jgi:carboxymethylenebutenolidase